MPVRSRRDTVDICIITSCYASPIQIGWGCELRSLGRGYGWRCDRHWCSWCHPLPALHAQCFLWTCGLWINLQRCTRDGYSIGSKVCRYLPMILISMHDIDRPSKNINHNPGWGIFLSTIMADTRSPKQPDPKRVALIKERIFGIDIIFIRTSDMLQMMLYLSFCAHRSLPLTTRSKSSIGRS